jgi:tetratricopeptide (TPR) repeat protein
LRCAPVFLFAVLLHSGCGATVGSGVGGQELVRRPLDSALAEILDQAQQSLSEGDVAGASDRYSSLVAAHPDDPWLAVLYQETRYRFAQGLREDEAELLVENLRGSYREKAEASPTAMNLLLAARSETDSYAALYLAERAIALDPGFAWGRYARAYALSRLGKMEAAKSEVEQAIKLDAGLLPAWRLLAWLRSRAGERDAAIVTWSAWLDAVEGDPRISAAARSEAIGDLGILLVRAKRHEEAMLLLDAALSDEMEVPELISRSSSVLAAAASEAGALEEALAALRVARASDPEELLFVVQEALLQERLTPHSVAAHTAWNEVIEQTQGATNISALLQRTRAEAHLAEMKQGASSEVEASD